MLKVIPASRTKNAFLSEFMKFPLVLAVAVTRNASDRSVFRLGEGTIIVFNTTSQLAEVAVPQKYRAAIVPTAQCSK